MGASKGTAPFEIRVNINSYDIFRHINSIDLLTKNRCGNFKAIYN